MSARQDGDWIQTYTGRKFHPLAPRAQDVDMLDIAHALSMKCRFGGHVLQFYSVAQHSVLVSYVVAQLGGDVRAQLAGLLHDASEAYLPDIAAPVKPSVCFAIHHGFVDWEHRSFKDQEKRIIEQVYAALDLGSLDDLDTRSLVKRADLVMLMTEARDLMTAPPEKWKTEAEFLAEKVMPLGPMLARGMFLGRLRKLLASLRKPLGKPYRDHVLYVDSDPDKPKCILDRNGEVVLDMCRICGRGEIELDEPCVTKSEGGAA